MRIIIVSNERRERSNVARKNWTCFFIPWWKETTRENAKMYISFFIKIKTL